MSEQDQGLTSSNTSAQHGPTTVMEARAVRWPFDPKEPMGTLLDRGQLSRSQLEWAARKARWPEVKAAGTILLAELHQRTHQPANRARNTNANTDTAQPTTPSAAPTASFAAPPARPTAPPAQLAAADEAHTAGRYGPRVITASSYLANQEENHLGAMGVAVGVGVMFVLYAVYETVRSLAAGQGLNAVSAVSFFIGLALCAWYIRRNALAWRNIQRGRQGEDQIVGALRSSLDNRWTIYRNLQLTDKQADLDLVLVGPGGVWAVQVKHFSNPLRYQGERWEYKAGRRWRWVDKRHDPGKVTGQAQRLSDYLAKQGITRWVDTAIALAEPVPEKNVEDSPVPVWLPFTIETRARSLATRTPPSRAEVERINALLERRADEQRAVEESKKRRGKA